MSVRRRPQVKGQSLVEFALIAPLLFSLMFILVELGIVFSIYVGLTNSAREAARSGTLYQYSPVAPVVPGCPTRPSAGDPSIDLVDCERAALMDAVIMDTRNPMLNISTGADLEPAGGGANDRFLYDPPTFPDAYRYGTKLIVTLEYQHGLFFNLLGPQSITLSARSEMRLEPGGL